MGQKWLQLGVMAVLVATSFAGILGRLEALGQEAVEHIKDAAEKVADEGKELVIKLNEKGQDLIGGGRDEEDAAFAADSHHPDHPDVALLSSASRQTSSLNTAVAYVLQSTMGKWWCVLAGLPALPVNSAPALSDEARTTAVERAAEYEESILVELRDSALLDDTRNKERVLVPEQDPTHVSSTKEKEAEPSAEEWAEFWALQEREVGPVDQSTEPSNLTTTSLQPSSSSTGPGPETSRLKDTMQSPTRTSREALEKDGSGELESGVEMRSFLQLPVLIESKHVLAGGELEEAQFQGSNDRDEDCLDDLPSDNSGNAVPTLSHFPLIRSLLFTLPFIPIT